MRTRRANSQNRKFICFQSVMGILTGNEFEFQDDLGCASPRFTAILIFRGCPVLDTSPHEPGPLERRL